MSTDNLFDFLYKDYSDPEVFLNDEYLFYVVHNSVCSIMNMTDRELRESIVSDILMITMWEKEHNKKVHYGFTKFLHWLQRDMHQQVLSEMKHDEISGLIDIQADEIRIKDRKEILQVAMDYCGMWYEGFIIPVGLNVITTSKETISSVVENAGGGVKLTEKIVSELQSLTMEQLATTTINSTLQ
jgi:hypothetical protein